MSQVSCDILPLRPMAQRSVTTGEISVAVLGEVTRFADMADTTGPDGKPDGVVTQPEFDAYVAKNSLSEKARGYIQTLMNGATCDAKAVDVRRSAKPAK